MRSSPSADPRLAFLVRRPFAHRGLHGGAIIENSRAAFDAAIAIGHGIELDVQASSDGEAIVFHDADLGRLTDAAGPLAARTADALAALRLTGTREHLAPLRDILARVRGRVPVLIEVKASGVHVAQLCEAVAHTLDGYGGEAAVMSFNPEVGAWFTRHRPITVRGLVVSEEGPASRWQRARKLLAIIASLVRARPDFLAYDIASLPSPIARTMRAKGRPVLSWTVRSDAQLRRAEVEADQIIHERRGAGAVA